MRRYVIIGGGAAGMAAAEEIRRRDSSGEITMVCEEHARYYSRPGLAYYLTGELPENMLFPYSSSDFDRLGLNWIIARALRLDARQHHLYLEKSRTLPYDRLLIATGAAALSPDLPGMNLEGVVKLDSLQDARAILKLARRGRTAVVVGGGITALEIVEGLLAHGVRTHYLMRGDHYWSSVLDETESSLIEERMRSAGAHLLTRSEVIEIIGRRGKVAGVRTRSGELIPADLFAYAIGIRPQSELARASGLEVERGILVDDAMRTSAADVFAAGDVAQVYDPLSGKFLLDSLWGPARAQGGVAGANMAGDALRYHKPPACNVTRLTGVITTLIGLLASGRDSDLAGIARGDSEVWRQRPEAIVARAHYEVNRLRLMIGERTLLGAVIMGDQAISRPIQRLVEAQADITPIRARLLAPGAPLAQMIIEYSNKWEKQEHAVQQP